MCGGVRAHTQRHDTHVIRIETDAIRYGHLKCEGIIDVDTNMHQSQINCMSECYSAQLILLPKPLRLK